jgi:hypothetical protein
MSENWWQLFNFYDQLCSERDPEVIGLGCLHLVNGEIDRELNKIFSILIEYNEGFVEYIRTGWFELE